jgi:hypothetical protein
MILETIGLAAGVFGHVKTKGFIRRKLRYTKVVEKSAGGMGLAAGAATAIALGALPIITVVPALLVGAGIGSGVALGIRQARGK